LNVFENDPSLGDISVSVQKVEEGEGEAGSVTGETFPFACDREVLAGEASCPEEGVLPTSGVLYPFNVGVTSVAIRSR